jgi:hypothetical protein
MAKISVPKILETSKLLSSKTGQELSELIQYVSTVSTQLIQSLRNGLNYEDNFDCHPTTVNLTHNMEQIVNRGSTRAPKEVRARRVVSTTTAVTALIWYLDNSGNLVVKAKFDGAPVTTQEVDLIVYF